MTLRVSLSHQTSSLNSGVIMIINKTHNSREFAGKEAAKSHGGVYFAYYTGQNLMFIHIHEIFLMIWHNIFPQSSRYKCRSVSSRQIHKIKHELELFPYASVGGKTNFLFVVQTDVLSSRSPFTERSKLHSDNCIKSLTSDNMELWSNLLPCALFEVSQLPKEGSMENKKEAHNKEAKLILFRNEMLQPQRRESQRENVCEKARKRQRGEFATHHAHRSYSVSVSHLRVQMRICTK